ncbi:MAG: c-type cytochrome [Pirellulaceae bacterium]
MHASDSLPRPLANWLACGLLLVAAPAYSQDEADDEESPYRPGLVATYSVPASSASPAGPISRVDEVLAHDWGQAAPDPRLPAGPFQAVWKGRLWTQVPGPYRLQVYAAGGRVSIRLADKEVIAAAADEPQWLSSDALDLGFDRHPLEVRFEKTGDEARLALYWSGPGFVLEPVPARFLLHDREISPANDFERGRRLATALRCAACHQEPADSQALPAPALDRLAGQIHLEWVAGWLAPDEPAREGEAPAEPRLVRRMPHFGLSQEEAADIAAWLVRPPPADKKVSPAKEDKPKAKGKSKGKSTRPSAGEGERLFLTLGCLACHQQGELGESGLFGGGDLTAIAAKRPPEFFARWLADPASLNRHHQMPVFELSADERTSLALWLAERGARVDNPDQRGESPRGEKLVAQFRCASCHELPGNKAAKPAPLKSLAGASEWSRSCAGSLDKQDARPGYQLSAADQKSLQTYYSQRATPRQKSPRAMQMAGRDLLVELNCLACHQREGIDREVQALPARLDEKLGAVVALHDDLGKLVPAMTPPALNSVGDKLHDAALANAIRREGEPHRPYLMVRMPKYNLSDEQLTALIAYFTATDRIPGREGEAPAEPAAARPMVAAMQAAGPRLVTTDGFGCTSCHQVGSVLPDKAPLNARGPSLSLLEKRIRREWFGRWCNNPARIVPRMEMPSVQVPVRGVLGENIDAQLAAVWHILNTPCFEPPEPNPVRVLRLSGVTERKESPIVLHDVIRAGDKSYLFPLVIGLPNRHNILFDLETNRLAAWWLGDTARQRTKGKSWFWEAGGDSIFDPGIAESELSLWIDGRERSPSSRGQFKSELDWFDGLSIARKMTFKVENEQGVREGVSSTVAVDVNDIISSSKGESGFSRQIIINGNRGIDKLRFRLVSEDLAKECQWNEKTRELKLPGRSGIVLKLIAPNRATWNADGSIYIHASENRSRHLREHAFCILPESHWAKWQAFLEIQYSTTIVADQFLAIEVESHVDQATAVQVAPGFNGMRLPLSTDMMPTGFSWSPGKELYFSSLKGQVFRATDTDGDNLEDRLETFADGLATPYGIFATKNHVDVLTKTGLVRFLNHDGLALSAQVIASGWGFTDDYHDWAVGLVRGEKGEYYLGLPCQQDNRSAAAAQHRGKLLKLVPRERARNEFREFDIEVVSSGHRFPMGLARNRAGDLFVSDNQGNYNPFNELNHVRPGAHFGFINANEKEQGFQPPPLAAPAIDIPHPWTRSVNGICFLDTPQELWQGPGKGIFGPLEGHLVGCEYDTRALIRMTLQKVGDTYQGAAYPLSIPPDNVDDGLLGPIVCAVSPQGELYVGNIRDSGWGAGNNIGDIVRIEIEPEKLPCGIAEVRATPTGFTLDFFRPIDRAKASDPANYSLASYRRESTSAYGGANLDRRSEKLAGIEISPDGRRVTLRLDDLRAGFVYEFQLKPLSPGREPFHPAEAHYTLRRVPE